LHFGYLFFFPNFASVFCFTSNLEALKFLSFTRRTINQTIDWFYIPFKKYIPYQTFKYAFCGGGNTALDIFLYFISYNFILHRADLNLRIIAIKPHIASFFITFPITFTSGFLLSKYITFKESALKGKTQLFRYGVTVFVCFLLNYVFLKLFVEYMHIYPTPSKLLTTCLVVIYSYFSQKYFSFKMENPMLAND
jgi:putative flippase GtrA